MWFFTDNRSIVRTVAPHLHFGFLLVGWIMTKEKPTPGAGAGAVGAGAGAAADSVAGSSPEKPNAAAYSDTEVKGPKAGGRGATVGFVGQGMNGKMVNGHEALDLAETVCPPSQPFYLFSSGRAQIQTHLFVFRRKLQTSRLRM